MSALVAKNIRVVRDGAELLSDISLDFGSTGAVAIIGPNGAGKSIFMKVLAGLEMPDAGQVVVDDRRLSDLSSNERAALIGYLPQQFEPHWNLTVQDLVELGAGRAPQPKPTEIEGLLEVHELSGMRRRRWSTLSGGERARVLLAMVLAVDPPILLADEPAASLDIRHRIDVAGMLARRGRNRLSVVIMHDLDLAFRLFDRIVVMDGGRIAATGTPNDLFADPILDRVFGVGFERVQSASTRFLLPNF